jgi:hypothetical protein
MSYVKKWQGFKEFMKSSNYVRKFSIYEKKNKAYFGKMQK